MPKNDGVLIVQFLKINLALALKMPQLAVKMLKWATHCSIFDPKIGFLISKKIKHFRIGIKAFLKKQLQVKSC